MNHSQPARTSGSAPWSQNAGVGAGAEREAGSRRWFVRQEGPAVTYRPSVTSFTARHLHILGAVRITRDARAGDCGGVASGNLRPSWQGGPGRQEEGAVPDAAIFASNPSASCWRLRGSSIWYDPFFLSAKGQLARRTRPGADCFLFVGPIERVLSGPTKIVGAHTRL